MSELPPDYPSETPPPRPPYEAPPTNYGTPGYGAPPPGPPGAAALPPLPFEDPTRPWLNGFFQTIALFIQNPRQGFERMSLTGDLLRPVVYALILGTAGYVVGTVWQVWMNESMKSWMPASAYEPQFPPGAMIWFAAMSPLIFVVLALVNVLISHVCLLIVGAGKSGMGATLRAICYAQTAMIVMLIPICGQFVSSIWYVVLEVIGFAVAHKTTYGKAALAVFIPLLVCCVCIAICFSLFGAAIMSQIQGMK